MSLFGKSEYEQRLQDLRDHAVNKALVESVGLAAAAKLLKKDHPHAATLVGGAAIGRFLDAMAIATPRLHAVMWFFAMLASLASCYFMLRYKM